MYICTMFFMAHVPCQWFGGVAAQRMRDIGFQSQPLLQEARSSSKARAGKKLPSVSKFEEHM